jgi:hypothetical protein
VSKEFTYVNRYKKSVGKSCQHCGRDATVTAKRDIAGFKWDVYYCAEHADEIIRGDDEPVD